MGWGGLDMNRVAGGLNRVLEEREAVCASVGSSFPG